MPGQKGRELSVCSGAAAPWQHVGGKRSAAPCCPLAKGCCSLTLPRLGFRSSSSLQLTASHKHAASGAEDRDTELMQKSVNGSFF